MSVESDHDLHPLVALVTGATSGIGRAVALKLAEDVTAVHDDVEAEVIAFLASPRASYVTGATIAVDGGRTAA